MRADCGPACVWQQTTLENLRVSRRPPHHDQTLLQREDFGIFRKGWQRTMVINKYTQEETRRVPSVEKEVPSKMVYVAMDAEISQAGSLRSSIGSRKRVVFMKIPSQPKLCLLQTCHGIHKRLLWQQLQILKPLYCFQTAALRFSRCVALHVHHASAINLPYCFAIKRGHCNTGVAHIHRMILTPEAD